MESDEGATTSWSDPSCSFHSATFDAAKALVTPNLCTGPQVEEFEDLYELKRKVHSQELKVMSHIGIEGVSGPGGIPLAKPARPKITLEGRQFPDRDKGGGDHRKRHRNVLNRMEEIEGPLATLRKCRDTKTKVKVYTRNHSEVRGVMTGYVVAFDKHWNIVLKDVYEIFQKKIKCKTPVFDDVSHFEKMADLSIREVSDEEPPSMVWLNAFAKTSKASKSQPKSSDQRQRGRDRREAEKHPRNHMGRRTDAQMSRGSRASCTKEANTLFRGRLLGKDPGSEEDRETRKDSEGKGAKRRRRKKIEMRERQAGQLLIRGENVVLVIVSKE